MRFRNTETRFGAMAMTLHWLVFALVVAMVALGWTMVPMPVSADKLRLYDLHKSIGVVALTLMALRLAWRFTSPPPPLPHHMKPWQRALARASHAFLYVILFAMPLSGWIMSSAANFPVSVFGLFTLPNLVAPDKALLAAAKTFHRFTSYALFALLALHVLGAFKHHLIDKDDVLRRMLPGRGGR